MAADTVSVKGNVVEQLLAHPWFTPISVGVVAYLFFGLFEESFGLTKPLRIGLAIGVVISYNIFGDDFISWITGIFSSLGLRV